MVHRNQRVVELGRAAAGLPVVVGAAYLASLPGGR